jgi:hypothetical protein
MTTYAIQNYKRDCFFFTFIKNFKLCVNQNASSHFPNHKKITVANKAKFCEFYNELFQS